MGRDKSTAIVWCILIGILQGNGLFGSLFAILIDPFFNKCHAEHTAQDQGHIRAAAGDLAAALTSFRGLLVTHETFMWLRPRANMRLNLSKCVIVRVRSRATPAAIMAVRNRSWI